MRRLAYRGRILTPVLSPLESREPGAATTVRYLEDGLVVVDDAGRIEEVAAAGAALYRGAALDLRPRVIVPGFVDAHVHSAQTRIVGRATGPLLDWLEQSVFPEEARMRDVEYARAVAREFVGYLIAAGTTTSAVFSSSSVRATDILFEELERSGLRALVGLTLMDRSCPDDLHVPRDEALRGCTELADKWHDHDGGRLRFAVTPRFALSCSRELMEAAARFAEERGLFVQTHVSENLGEGDATLAAHPFADDYLDVYDKVGLLGPRTILAHGVHLSQREWDRIAERGARIAHCPDSNFFLGSGRMRVSEAQRRKIPVGLGSDVAGGRSFNLTRAMSYAHDNAVCVGEPLPPEALFVMATAGGAHALGIADATGTLEPGKLADFVALRLPDHVAGKDGVLGTIVFATDLTSVDAVFVRGRRIAHEPPVVNRRS
jgi:guanine deaminase